MANDKTIIFRCSGFLDNMIDELSNQLDMSKSKVIRCSVMLFHELITTPEMTEEEMNKLLNMLIN